MNQDALTHLELRASEESVVRGDESFRHCTRFDPIELFGNAREVAFRDDDKLSLPPSRGDPENAVADFPGRRCVSQRFDFTSEFEARDVLRVTRRRGISSA